MSTAAEPITVEQAMENRRKLSAALRSGEYTQGRMRLRTDGGNYCCLGVGCVVVCGIQLSPGADNGPSYHAIRAACGFTRHQLDALTTANDNSGKSFPEIADLIDAMPAPEVGAL